MTDWTVWGKDAMERAAKTGMQVLIAAWTADGVIGVMDVNWIGALSAAAIAVLVSLGTSFVSTGAGDPSSASLVDGGKTRMDPPTTGPF